MSPSSCCCLLAGILRAQRPSSAPLPPSAPTVRSPTQPVGGWGGGAGLELRDTSRWLFPMPPSSKIRSLCPMIALPWLEAELFNVAATLISPRSPFAKSSGTLSAGSRWARTKGGEGWTRHLVCVGRMVQMETVWMSSMRTLTRADSKWGEFYFVLVVWGRPAALCPEQWAVAWSLCLEKSSVSAARSAPKTGECGNGESSGRPGPALRSDSRPQHSAPTPFLQIRKTKKTKTCWWFQVLFGSARGGTSSSFYLLKSEPGEWTQQPGRRKVKGQMLAGRWPELQSISPWFHKNPRFPCSTVSRAPHSARGWRPAATAQICRGT